MWKAASIGVVFRWAEAFAGDLDLDGLPAAGLACHLFFDSPAELQPALVFAGEPFEERRPLGGGKLLRLAVFEPGKAAGERPGKAAANRHRGIDARDREARTSDVVLGVGAALDRDLDIGAAIEAGRLFKAENGCLVVPDSSAVNRPAGLVLVIVERGLDRQVAGILLVGSARGGDLDWSELRVRILEGADGDLQISEAEVSVAGSPGPVFRHRGVGESLDPKRADFPGGGGSAQHVEIFRAWILAGGQDGAVRELLQGRAVLRFDFREVEDLPGSLRGSRRGAFAEPGGEAFFKLSPGVGITSGEGFFFRGLPGGESLAVFAGVDRQIDLAADRGAEGRQQTVIVARWDRVKFVVVTSGAADRQAEHGRAHGVDHVIELVVA